MDLGARSRRAFYPDPPSRIPLPSSSVTHPRLLSSLKIRPFPLYPFCQFFSRPPGICKGSFVWNFLPPLLGELLFIAQNDGGISPPPGSLPCLTTAGLGNPRICPQSPLRSPQPQFSPCSLGGLCLPCSPGTSRVHSWVNTSHPAHCHKFYSQYAYCGVSTAEDDTVRETRCSICDDCGWLNHGHTKLSGLNA